MNAEVFWISATELDFCGRIYTWDGRCWADKNGVSRTLYLMDKGVITAGFCRWLKTSQSRLKRKDILHVYVIERNVKKKTLQMANSGQDRAIRNAEEWGRMAVAHVGQLERHPESWLSHCYGCIW